MRPATRAPAVAARADQPLGDAAKMAIDNGRRRDCGTTKSCGEERADLMNGEKLTPLRRTR
jgi:hypothetical protein